MNQIRVHQMVYFPIFGDMIFRSGDGLIVLLARSRARRSETPWREYDDYQPVYQQAPHELYRFLS